MWPQDEPTVGHGRQKALSRPTTAPSARIASGRLCRQRSCGSGRQGEGRRVGRDASRARRRTSFVKDPGLPLGRRPHLPMGLCRMSAAMPTQQIERHASPGGSGRPGDRRVMSLHGGWHGYADDAHRFAAAQLIGREAACPDVLVPDFSLWRPLVRQRLVALQPSPPARSSGLASGRSPACSCWGVCWPIAVRAPRAGRRSFAGWQRGQKRGAGWRCMSRRVACWRTGT